MQGHLVSRLLLCSLCVLLACGGDNNEPELTGSGDAALEVITSTSGVPEDPDGYAVTVDHGAAQSLASNGSRTVSGLSPGSHTIELAGIVGFCVLDGENPRTVDIAAGDTTLVRFEITCERPVLEISVSTTGAEPDYDGYGLLIDGEAVGSVIPDDTVRIPSVSSGPHTIDLTGISGNCAVIGEHPRPVDVVDGIGSVHFDIACHISTNLGVYVEMTDGGDPDPDFYVARLNGGSPVAIFSGPGVYRGGWYLPPGDYTITLSDVAPHCRLSGSNTATATVTTGDTTMVNFTVSCGTMKTGRFGRDLLVGAHDELYLLSADGSRFVQLTNNADGEFHPTFSPDGRKIAFASIHYVVDIPGPFGSSHWESNVFTMNPDGSGRTQLTDGFRDEGPAWSPDGSRLVFIGTARGGTSHVFVMNADGSGLTSLVDLGGSSPYLSHVPAWSPEGSRIAYSGPGGIFVINPDGSNETRLTDGADVGAAWSPDGTRIAFVRYEGIGQGDAVYVMNADGSGLTRVASDTAGGQQAVSWSPDGTKIAFELGGKVYLANRDGTGLAQLTFGWHAYAPIWSPDGTRIAYGQLDEHELRLYLMELDGSGEVPLTPALGPGAPSAAVAAGRSPPAGLWH
jgi:Tol biopolymer transport system component